MWIGDGRYLLWSDIPNDRILKWEEETGAVSVFRKPSHNSNGNTRDRQGRLVTCEHGARRVTRAWKSMTARSPVLCSRVDMESRSTRRTTSSSNPTAPVWLTDPPFGIPGNYEGDREVSPPNCRSRASTASTGRPEGDRRRRIDIRGPNGLAFARQNEAVRRRDRGLSRNARSAASMSPTTA